MNKTAVERLVVVLAVLTLAFVPISALAEDSDSTVLDFSRDYYYNQLSEREQALYREIYSASLNFESEIDTGFEDGTLKDTGINTIDAVRYDHPEIFYLKNSCRYNDLGTLTIQYSINKDQYASMKTTIDDSMNVMLEGIPSNRTSAIAWINEMIVRNTAYDTSAVDNPEAYRAHNISGVLIDGKAVCEGYALTFKYMCDRVGIPCICVVGDGSSDGSTPSGHMWNYVMVGERWYAMDVTWNDPVPGGGKSATVSTRFSLVGSDTINNSLKFSESHIVSNLSESLGVPTIQTSSYTSTIGNDISPNYSDFVPYYYSKLSEDGKKAYDAIVEGAMNFETTISTGVTVDTNTLFDAVRAVKLDRQDLFQIPSKYTCWSNGDVSFEYSITPKQYETMCNQILRAMQPLNEKLTSCDSIYERVIAIHDYIVDSMRYSEDTGNPRNLYGTFVEKKGVCEAYARSFQYMCNMCGIQAICVIGTGTNSGGSEGHMWNMVLMNNDIWYNMDVTWDDPLVNGSDSGKVRHTYFLVGSDTKEDGRTFDQSHIADMATGDEKTNVFSNSILPAVSKTDYYIRPGASPNIDIIIPSTGTADKCTMTVTVSELENAQDLAQGVGIPLIPFDGVKTKLGFSSNSISMLIDYMKANSISEITIVSEKTSEKVSIGPIGLDNDVFSFRILADGIDLDLKDVGKGFKVALSIPFSAEGLDIITPLIFAWESDDALMPILSSKYSDGYVTFEVESLESSYAVGSTPVKGVPVIFLIIGIIIILLIIKVALSHHKKKKQNA